MTRSTEEERIALLSRVLAWRGASSVDVAIGDDAAVLQGGAARLVWTIDAQVDGTHFRTDWASWEDIGWRSFMAAASDLAAMGAEPLAALSALSLAPSVSDDDLEALARGQALAASQVGAPVAGGNLARGTETSITTTLLGRVALRPLLRAGARAGDGVWLAGPVGMAAAGLAALEARARDASADPFVRAWRRPVARIAEGRVAASSASAAVDVSDGLARDAMHLARASDVRLVLEEEAILAASGGATLAQALHGGEDYALLATSATALPGFVRIGSVEAYDSKGSRLVLSSPSPAGRSDLAPKGFDHFAK